MQDVDVDARTGRRVINFELGAALVKKIVCWRCADWWCDSVGVRWPRTKMIRRILFSYCLRYGQMFGLCRTLKLQCGVVLDWLEDFFAVNGGNQGRGQRHLELWPWAEFINLPSSR